MTIKTGAVLTTILVLVAANGVAVADAQTANSMPVPGKEFQDCEGCPVMVAIPSGSFTMGSPEGETYGQPDEHPQRRVTINHKFAMGKYEVTVAEYRKFAEETKRVNSNTCITGAGLDEKGLLKTEVTKERDWRNPGYAQTDRNPVVCVTWNDADDYTKWLSAKTGKSYRLPSEAEFEYAARAGTTTLWFWGNDPNESCKYANMADLTAQEQIPGWVSVPKCKDGYLNSSPVGSFAVNPWGLYDVVGNAQEWLADCTSNSYVGAPTDGSAWLTGGDCDYRIHRGGSVFCTLTCNPATVPPAQVNNVQPAAVGRVANRDRKIISFRNNGFGFRVARSE